MSVLFANTRVPTSSPKYLVEFKAGKTEIQAGSEPGKRKAIALAPKGLVYLTVSNDNLLHFCWKNRETNKDEDDYIIFPGDAEFLRIKECTDGRVYMLKFKSSDHRHLYWMQEPAADKDEDICKKVNDLLNNPAPQRASVTGTATDRNTNMVNAAFHNILGSGDLGPLSNMDQNQIMQFLMGGGAAGVGLDHLPQQIMLHRPVSSTAQATAVEQTPTARPSAGSKPAVSQGTPPETGMGGLKDSGITKEALQAVIAAAAASSSKRLSPVELSALLSRANVQEAVAKNVERLTPHLPDQSPVLDASGELEQTVGNPQFQQASEFFGQALQTGQLAQVLNQFGLKSDVVNAARDGDFLKFSEKLTEQEGGGAKNVDKEIAEHADAEESVESAVRNAERKEKKAEEDGVDLTKRPPKDDDMELD